MSWDIRRALPAAGAIILCAAAIVSSPLLAAAQAIEGGKLAVPRPNGDGIRVYRAIPYAAPPVGARRWQPPRAVEAWSGTRETGEFAPDCMQAVSESSPAGRPRSEDCLYLNVWSPAVEKTKLPVFVWIHGGGSRVGSGAQPTFDGTALARKGIVVVTINYRLGPLGFLSTPELTAESSYGASGNYGFMDVIAALGWVKRNIGQFDGDASKVTIGGESSGSVTTSVLMASPLAAGLFQQAIGESGSSFRKAEPGSMGATDLASEEARGAKLMAATGAGDLAAFRALPAAQILAAADRLSNGQFYNLPVVDGHVLPDAPWRRFAAGAFNDVPLLAGWNADEGSLMLLGPRRTFSQFLEATYGPQAKTVAALYPHTPDQDQATLVDAAGHNNIAYPTWLWAYAATRFGRSPVYVYEFDHAPPLPVGRFGPDFDVRLAGAYHGAEIPYVFDTLDAQKGWRVADEDRAVATQMSGYWASFIRTGAPGGRGTAHWPRYEPGRNPMRMRIATHSRAEHDPDYERFMGLMKAHSAIDPALPAAPVTKTSK